MPPRRRCGTPPLPRQSPPSPPAAARDLTRKEKKGKEKGEREKEKGEENAADRRPEKPTAVPLTLGARGARGREGSPQPELDPEPEQEAR